MKLAAAHALAALAKEDVPDSVIRAYGGKPLRFGREYLIPKPFDYRVLLWEAPAVAEAAIRTGVARKPVQLQRGVHPGAREPAVANPPGHARRLRPGQGTAPKRIVFPEGEAHEDRPRRQDPGRGGHLPPDPARRDRRRSRRLLIEHEVPPRRGRGHRPAPGRSPRDLRRRAYSRAALAQGRHRPWTRHKRMHDPVYFGNMMVHEGDADGLISGLTMHYPDTIRPALQVHRTRPGRQPRRRGLPAAVQGPHALHRRHHRQPGPDRPRSWPRSRSCAAEVARRLLRGRARASRCSRTPTSAPTSTERSTKVRSGGRDRARALARAGDRRRDAGRHRGRADDRGRRPTRSRPSRATPTSSSAPTSRPPTSPTSCSGGSARSRRSARSSPASARRCTCCSAGSRSTTSSTWPRCACSRHSFSAAESAAVGFGQGGGIPAALFVPHMLETRTVDRRSASGILEVSGLREPPQAPNRACDLQVLGYTENGAQDEEPPPGPKIGTMEEGHAPHTERADPTEGLPRPLGGPLDHGARRGASR